MKDLHEVAQPIAQVCSSLFLPVRRTVALAG